MTGKDARAIALFDSLPTQTKRNLRKQGIRIEDLESITGAVTVKNMIHSHFVIEASMRAQLQREKVKLGYCGGFVNCLTFIGKNPEHNACARCRRHKTEWAQNRGEKGFRRNRVSEYGQMRAKERADERTEKE